MASPGHTDLTVVMLKLIIKYIAGLVQDCNISSMLAVEILQSSAKP